MEDTRRQNILLHLDKIEQYARQPGNEWLMEELQRRFGATDPDVKRIEKYLALDYTIDNIPIRVDYSFVTDEILRMKLVSDWREMLRYRCHIRNHKPDFLEFCRYAHMQAEGITNYYCSCKYSIEKELFSACEIPEGKTTVTYWNKLLLLKKQNVISNADKEFFYQKLYAVRNIQSHRGETNLSDYYEKTRSILTELIKQQNLPTLKDDETILNTYRIKVSEKEIYSQPYAIFEQQLKFHNIDYSRYEALAWCKKKPYEEVEAKLEKLVSNIKHTLTTK